MNLRLPKALVSLAAAVLIGGAWGLHVISAHHEAADNDCQVCAVAVAPELNADCGTALLVRPDLPAPAAPERVVQPARSIPLAAFYGRAPPLA